MESSTKKIKAIVTGATGHIGSEVARQLLKKGYAVTLLVRRENAHTRKLTQHGAVVVVGDLMEPKRYQAAFNGCQVLFHCAAENTTSIAQPQRTLDNTFGLARCVVNAALDSGVQTIVYTSSVVVLGRSDNPARLLTEDDCAASGGSPYVEGKLQAERYVQQLVRERGADIRTVYPCWVLGEGDLRGTPPHQTLAKAMARRQLLYFEGGISVAHVEDIAHGHIAAFELGQPGGRYVLGGENITFKQLYTLASADESTPPLIKLPAALIFIGALGLKLVGRLIGKNPPIDPAYVKMVIGKYSWYDCSKARCELGYRIRTAQQTIRSAKQHLMRMRAQTLTLGDHYSTIAAEERDEQKGLLLITGVPGWLGNRLVDILINGDGLGRYATHRQVRLLVQPHYRGLLDLPANFEVVYGDITDPSSLDAACCGVQTVFHLAGAIYPPHIRKLYEVNYSGTRNLVDCCILHKVRRILYMSTDAVCGHGDRSNRIFTQATAPKPYKHYGRSKYLAERYILSKVQQGHLDATVLRGFWFFGPFAPPRQLDFVKMFRWPRQVVFGNGTNLRTISHVDNTISAFIEAEQCTATFGKSYWIGGAEQPHTVNEIYAAIAQQLGVPFRPLYVPIAFCKLFGLADTLLAIAGRLHPTIHAAGKFYFDIAGEIEAARRDFGYEPKVTFAMAIKELAKAAT